MRVNNTVMNNDINLKHLEINYFKWFYYSYFKSVVNVPHATAVEALKRAGTTVRLVRESKVINLPKQSN